MRLYNKKKVFLEHKNNSCSINTNYKNKTEKKNVFNKIYVL